MRGLCCCMRAFSSRRKRELLIAVHGLPLAVAFLVVEHRLWGERASVVAVPGLPSTGSLVVRHELSCSEACGIFLDQGSNPCLLHRQADSLPLSHQGSPKGVYTDQLQGSQALCSCPLPPRPQTAHCRGWLPVYPPRAFGQHCFRSWL